jgi:hypothetical protein
MLYQYSGPIHLSDPYLTTMRKIYESKDDMARPVPFRSLPYLGNRNSNLCEADLDPSGLLITLQIAQSVSQKS